MENASKALLIAGAIIIVILIISFGMYIWQKAQSAADLGGMDEAATEAFNAKLQKYEGDKKGNELVGLVNTINNLNQNENAEDNVNIQDQTNGNINPPIQTAGQDAGTGLTAVVPTNGIKRNTTYRITCSAVSDGSRIDTVTITIP